WSVYVRKLAPLLSEEERTPTLKDIFQTARRFHLTSELLVDIIRLLPLDEALAAARCIDDNPYYRSKGLAVLAPRLAETATPQEAALLWIEIMDLLDGR